MRTSLFYIFMILVLSSIASCKEDGTSDLSSADEKDKDKETPTPTPPTPPTDPLANVLYTIQMPFIYKGAGTEGEILYRIAGDHLIDEQSPNGDTLYTCNEHKFLFGGSKALGKPVYYLNDDYVCTVEPFRAVYHIENGKYVRKRSANISKPLFFYSGEVAFNIEGQHIRKGSDPDGDILFTIANDRLYLGRTNKVMFSKHGNEYRTGENGAIAFTRHGDTIRSGKNGDILFNINGNLIRKGASPFAIGEAKAR